MSSLQPADVALGGASAAAPTPTAGRPRVALASRGDPLTPYLHAALAERYAIAGEVNVELGGWRRAGVGALTFRFGYDAWAERYMKSKLGFDLRSRLAARRLPDPRGYDAVVQTHALFSTLSPRALVYVDCTYRQAMAGWPAWTPQHGRARRRWLDVETACFAQAEHLFAFTAESRRSLIADYGIDPARVTVVGAGVNFDARQISAPLRPVEVGGAPTILFVGKDFTRKGGHVLLDAFGMVREQLPDVRLQIVGGSVPGPTPPGVDAVGHVTDRRRMTELYQRASVFCLPSLFDPSPLVVLEAMAHGLPCVVSRAASHHVRGSVVEFSTIAGTAATGLAARPSMDTAGFAVPTADPITLAGALISVLLQPGLADELGSTALRVVSERYLWRHVVARMAPQIESLAASRTPARSGH